MAVSPKAETASEEVAPVEMDDTQNDADVQMVLDVLRTIEPPLKAETSTQLAKALKLEKVNLPTLAKLGHEELAGACTGLDPTTLALKMLLSRTNLVLAAPPFSVASSVERARIISTVENTPFAPPPTDLFGGPVVVYPKIGFTRLDSFDTVNSTVAVRFFLDLYWTDPRIKGKSYVPDGMWRPAGVLVINRTEEMEGCAAESKPVIADADPENGGRSKNGLLLWPAEYSGTIINPMKLRGFPFDFDSVCIKLQQPEEASAEDFVFRTYDDPVDEYNAVRFFFDIGDQLSEWQLRGHSVAVCARTAWLEHATSHCHSFLRHSLFLWLPRELPWLGVRSARPLRSTVHRGTNRRHPQAICQFAALAALCAQLAILPVEGGHATRDVYDPVLHHILLHAERARRPACHIDNYVPRHVRTPLRHRRGAAQDLEPDAHRLPREHKPLHPAGHRRRQLRHWRLNGCVHGHVGAARAPRICWSSEQHLRLLPLFAHPGESSDRGGRRHVQHARPRAVHGRRFLRLLRLSRGTARERLQALLAHDDPQATGRQAGQLRAGTFTCLGQVVPSTLMGSPYQVPDERSHK